MRRHRRDEQGDRCCPGRSPRTKRVPHRSASWDAKPQSRCFRSIHPCQPARRSHSLVGRCRQSYRHGEEPAGRGLVLLSRDRSLPSQCSPTWCSIDRRKQFLRVHFWAISEFPKWRKYLISLSFRGQSSVRPVQVGGFDVNIVIHRSTAVRGRGGPARHDAWPPSLGAILAHTDGPCGS